MVNQENKNKPETVKNVMKLFNILLLILFWKLKEWKKKI